MRRKTQEEFLKEAHEKHPDLNYDYSLVKYVNNRTKVTIIDPDYGNFDITPFHFNVMLQGHPKRGMEKRIRTRTLSTDEFIKKCKSIRTDIDFDYSKVSYVHNRKEVCIIDPVYGEFFITPNNFIQGVGHPERGGTKLSNTDEFITKAMQVQPHIKYDYSNVVYVNNKTKVHIIDPDYGSFFIIPNSFLSGRGHPERGNHSQIYAYIHTINENGIIIGLKYGIENIQGSRYKEQDRSSVYSIGQFKSFKFNTVQDCKNAEKECRKMFGKGIILKENMKDGYTETTHTSNLQTIIDVYLKWGGVIH